MLSHPHAPATPHPCHSAAWRPRPAPAPALTTGPFRRWPPGGPRPAPASPLTTGPSTTWPPGGVCAWPKQAPRHLVHEQCGTAAIIDKLATTVCLGNSPCLLRAPPRCSSDLLAACGLQNFRMLSGSDHGVDLQGTTDPSTCCKYWIVTWVLPSGCNHHSNPLMRDSDLDSIGI